MAFLLCVGFRDYGVMRKAGSSVVCPLTRRYNSLKFRGRYYLDWKTFTVEIVKAVAWPLVVAVIAFQLKDKISELLPRIKKLKHKDTELEFAEGVSKLVREQEAEGNNQPEVPVTNEVQERYNFLLKLADISPRSAVLEAFREIEHASASTISKLSAEPSAHGGKSPLSMQRQLSELALTKNEVKMFNQLRVLRNKAAHDRDFNLHGMPIEAYIDLSLSLANRISLAGTEL